MATFKDVNGREWRVALDGPTVEKIHERLGLDISAEDGTGLIRCCATGPMIVRACYLVCEDQLGGMTPEAFGKALSSGEVIEGAEKALRQAVTDFTRPSRRPALTAVLDSQDRVTTRTMEALKAQVTDPGTQDKMVDAMKAKMTDVIEHIVAKLRETSPSTAAGSPDTSDATPAA